MQNLELMDVFTKSDNISNFLENLVFKERTTIQSLEGFTELNFDDAEQVIAFARDAKIIKGFSIMQNFINVMQNTGLWNPYAFLEIADKLSMDTESNELLYHNCINPLTKSLLKERFSWEIFSFVYAVLKDTTKACKLFDLDEDSLQECLEDLKLGKIIDTGFYRIKKYGDVAVEHATRCKDVSYYEEARKMKFFEDFPDVVDKYVGRVPNGVLSAILLFAAAKNDLTPLDYYESKFNNDSYWRNVLGFSDEVISSYTITEGIASNIMVMHQILHGANIEHYGNEPIKNIFLEKVVRFKKESEVPPYVAKREPLSSKRSVYIIDADKSHFRFCESSIPYLLDKIEGMISSFNVPGLKDCKMDWRPLPGHQNITIRAVYFNTKEIIDAFDAYEFYSVDQIFSLLTVDTIIEILYNFSMIGKKVKCHDPILLIALYVLLKSGFNAMKWCQAYITDPLGFAYGFNRAITGYLMGADDYAKLFNIEGPQWFNSYKEVSVMIREHYNLAASCFNYLMFKTSKIATFEDDTQLDYNFPTSIIIMGRNATRTINLYEVLEDPQGYADLLRNLILGDVLCKKDAEGNLVLRQNTGGVKNAM